MVEREKSEGADLYDRDEIYSKVVRAGKRTYFFDVKSTRREDYYLTITESKKSLDKDGQAHYEKHKLFLYKEDFDKFFDGFRDAVDFIGELLSGAAVPGGGQVKEDNAFSSVEFEDLEDTK
jgi:hypothetical protein